MIYYVLHFSPLPKSDEHSAHYPKDIYKFEEYISAKEKFEELFAAFKLRRIGQTGTAVWATNRPSEETAARSVNSDKDYDTIVLFAIEQ
jgi:hypothetical protein